MKFFVLIIAFFFVTDVSFSQNIVVEYEEKVILPPEILKILSRDDIKMIASRPLRKSFLYHSNGKSSYRIQTDTLFAIGYEDKTGGILMYEKAVFKDLFEENLSYVDMLNDSTTVAIEQIVSKKDWYKTGETKEILGYKCHHIQKRNKYGVMQNVWYTSDISIFDGPDDIYGFSGLVLEYEKGGKTLKAVEIKRNEKGRYSLFPPKAENTISYIEFLNRLKGRMKF